MLTAREQALGVPGAIGQVGGLRQAITDSTNLLQKVAPGVQGRTANSLVTAAQANRIIQNESAPIASNLNQQQQAYTGANSDLERLLQQAQQQAQLEVSAEDRKIAGLKTIYAALFEKEQAERAAQLEREKLAAAERQAAAARAASSGGGISLGGLSGGGGGGGAAAGGARMAQRADGGFNFVNAGGQPISAATFAQQTGRDIRDVLYAMGAAGDKYAATLYNQIVKDPFFVQNYAKYVSSYSPIFWGSSAGAAKSGYSAPASVQSSGIKSLLQSALTPAKASNVLRM